MIMYKAQELLSLIEHKLQKNTNGILALETQVSYWQKQRVGMLVIRDGILTYGGSTIPNNLQFATSLNSRMSSDSLSTTLPDIVSKLKDSQSVRELTEKLVRLNFFNWEKIEALIHHQVLLMLEKFILYPGQAKWHNSNDFDLSFGKDGHGLNWKQLKIDLRSRQIKWARLNPIISSMDAVPYVCKNNLSKVKNLKIKTHLEMHIDGHRTLLDIATTIGKDPLRVANSYANWANLGIINFNQISEVKSQAETAVNLPIILSVDDSPIVQICIKRALEDHYQVICVSGPFDAFNVLHQKSIDLILLDLNMPEMNGLEFCMQIRKTPKTKNLPIVMLTARDGAFDEMKGQIAGADKYITKPFKSQELIEVIMEQLSLRISKIQ